MIHRRICSLSAILAGAVLCLGSPPTAAAQKAAAELAGEDTWLRQTVQIKESPSSETQLRIMAPGLNTVYFNGQRLLRNTTVNDIVAWNVGSLIRKGTNCVSIAVGKGETLRHVMAVILPSHGKSNPLNRWKATTEVPPVGWHQTDFNDRDWKPAPQVAASQDIAKAKAKILPWVATGTSTHVVDRRLQFRDGDHVVLLGGTFIERAQQFGHLEAALTTAAGEANVTFRNLGWSADTVFAESRGIFDAPAKGYERMIEHVRAEEPTVIIVCCGQNEAMSFSPDAAGVERFKTQLRTLHGDLTAAGAEIVFLTPHPFVTLAPPLPDAARWNGRLLVFSEAVGDIADDVGSVAIDLMGDFVEDLVSSSRITFAAAGGASYGPSASGTSNTPSHPELDAIRNSLWTDNGMHWNDSGYELVAQLVASRLCGAASAKPVVSINASERTVNSQAGQVRDVQWQDVKDSLLTFQFRADQVSRLPVAIEWTSASSARVEIAAASSGQKTTFECASELEDGEAWYVAWQSVDYQRLRQLVVDKNELYFHRWRPQNITYLFGFRKHEQGNNASDIAKFDPLIEELEEKIQRAKQPQWQTVIVKLP